MLTLPAAAEGEKRMQRHLIQGVVQRLHQVFVLLGDLQHHFLVVGILLLHLNHLPKQQQ